FYTNFSQEVVSGNVGIEGLVIDGVEKARIGQSQDIPADHLAVLSWMETLLQGNHTIKIQWKTAANSQSHVSYDGAGRTLIVVEL
ncbi:MAG TPA: hypothetical protein PLQ35_15235, partial [bacterium]|nr:hypothetical protein [bacterium]HQL63637.1 hypothetical protein [bacterium]